MLEMEVPALLLGFLRGPAEGDSSRPWSRKEARGFGDVHRTLSELLCACDVREMADQGGEVAGTGAEMHNNPFAIDGGVELLPPDLKQDVFMTHE